MLKRLVSAMFIAPLSLLLPWVSALASVMVVMERMLDCLLGVCANRSCISV